MTVTVAHGIMITTAQSIPRRAVREYLGLVSGEALGELESLERSLAMPGLEHAGVGAHALQRAMQSMARRASEIGATVVIGVGIDYTAIGPGALLISVTGTAARL